MLGMVGRQENTQKHVHVDVVSCDNLEEGSDHALLIANQFSRLFLLRVARAPKYNNIREYRSQNI